MLLEFRPPSVHSGTHRRLLRLVRAQQAPSGRLDAIVVPTARPASQLRHAMRLARDLRCTLVALCSVDSKADEVLVEWERSRPCSDLVAIDLPSQPPAWMPRFTSSDHVAGENFQRHNDIWIKRNLGLALGRVLGWSAVVFLDDDITVTDPTHLEHAAGLLGEHDSVGLDIQGFPDNSVVCHANRISGGFQETFVGGGALAVPTDRAASFFPDIYNEDWFFLLGLGMRRVALTGRAMQGRYDPFANADRARAEELGDTLAEGLFALLDGGDDLGRANKRFWTRYLVTRRRLINDIRRRLPSSRVDSKRRDRMLTSLGVAEQTLEQIRPGFCVDYLQTWQDDVIRWRSALAELRPHDVMDDAIRELGLDMVTKFGEPRERPAARSWGATLAALPAMAALLRR
jgi:hypothetical protein